MHWDGKTLDSSPNLDVNLEAKEGELSDVAAISADDVWAVGSYNKEGLPRGWFWQSQALILHWDGNTWSIVPGPQIIDETGNSKVYTELIAVSAVSENDVWAAGSYSVVASSVVSPTFDQRKAEMLIAHWDGSQWKKVDVGTGIVKSNGLNDIVAVSANDVWVIGGQILHWDGIKWSESGPYNGRAMGASRSDDVWSVGSTTTTTDTDPITDYINETLTLHWDGKSWQLVDSPNPDLKDGNWLTGVAAIASNDAWAIGDRWEFFDRDNVQRSIVFHWNGKEWLEVDAPTPYGSQNLHDIAAVAPGEMWVAGAYAPGDISEYVPNPLVARYVECPDTGGN
jgi:hypothetical protein